MDKLYKYSFSFFTFLYLCSLTYDGVFIRQVLTILFFILSICVFISHRIRFSNKKIISILLLLIVFLIAGSISPNPDWKLKILFVFSGVAFLSVSLALYIIDYRNYFFHFFIYIMMIILIRLYMVHDENLIFFQASRNIVATYIIFPTIACFFILRQQKMFILLSLISLAICFLLKGRTAIILSSILVCVAIYRCYGLRFLILASICIAPFFLLISFVGVEELFISHTNFSEGLETTRSIIYAEYFNDFSIEDFILGRSFEGMSIISILNNNPHNSFLLIHSLFGIIPTLILLIYFIVSILVVKRRYGYLNAIVLALIPIKAMTDSVLFFNILDVFYMLPVMIMLAGEKIQKNNSWI